MRGGSAAVVLLARHAGVGIDSDLVYAAIFLLGVLGLVAASGFSRLIGLLGSRYRLG